jgi:hypothetical protein
MTNFVKIQDTNYVRDIHSKAVLNTDRKALDEYLMKKEIAKKQQEETEDTKQKLHLIEKEMQEIKELLLDLKSMRTTNAN